jgi:hypothetical protein
MRIARVVIIGLVAACGPAGTDGPQGDPGPAGAPGAQGSAGPAGTTGQDIAEVVSTGQIQVTAATSYSLVPGLTITTTVPANAKVHVDTNGGIQCTGTGAAYSVVDVAVFIDNAITGAQRRVVAANTTGVAQMLQTWSFGRTFPLSAGVHTIEVRVTSVDPNAATANVSSAMASQLQGVLTVTTLKL